MVSLTNYGMKELQIITIYNARVFDVNISQNTIHSFPFTGVFITMRYKLHSIHCNLVASLYKCFGKMPGDQNHYHMAPESDTAQHTWYSTIDIEMLYHLHGALPIAHKADSAGSSFHCL